MWRPPFLYDFYVESGIDQLGSTATFVNDADLSVKLNELTLLLHLSLSFNILV
jgi:hypothetical protein